MTDAPPPPISRLLGIMAALRHPETGCPWDREQDFATIAPYTIEEAYEVAEAIRADDREGLLSELGDLLFQVVFYAQMSREEGGFDFDDIVRAVCDKMVRRHPHVFAAGAPVADAGAQTRNWENIKAAERRRAAPAEASVLDDVPLGFPALLRASKLQRRAARVGFDWRDSAPVFAKADEELAELREAAAGDDRDAQKAELGDLLFACANLSRHLGFDPEEALRAANAKFERRFRRVERWLAERGRSPEDATIEEMDALWERAKAEERSAATAGGERDADGG